MKSAFPPFLSRALIFLVLASGTISLLAEQRNGNVDLPRYPAVSPDGESITFSWRGDIWKVGSDGGHATRLTSHRLDDLRSFWSPDGERIAFTSMRDGYLNIWVMNEDGRGVRQVTQSDRFCRLSGWGTDEHGEAVLTFSGYHEADIYRDQRPYKVPLEGGDFTRLHDAFGSEPVVSPDGTRIAFTRGGRYAGWERRHYEGPEAMRIWLYDRRDDAFTRLTHREGNDGKARWLDDSTLIYLSDRALDTVNLYRMSAEDGDEERSRLTGFEGKDVQDFDVAAEGKLAVMMVWDSLYTLDLGDPDAEPEALTITATEDHGDNVELRSVDRSVSEARLSPDGQVMAYVSYGRVYVRNVDDKSPTRRVSPDNHARHKEIAWSPDGLKLYFVSDQDETESIYAATVALTRSEIRESYQDALEVPEKEPKDEKEGKAKEKKGSGKGKKKDGKEADAEDDHESASTLSHRDASAREGSAKKKNEEEDEEEDKEEQDEDEEEEEALDPEYDPERWHDAVRFDIVPVVQTEHLDRRPRPSPNGERLAFRRGRGDLMLLDLDSGHTERLIEGWDSRIHWRWSPDSRHIAYSQNDMNFSANIFIVEVDGETDPVNITRHPRNDVSPRWSADGRILTFRSNRMGMTYDLWRVYLDRNLEALTPRELEDYYEEAIEKAEEREPLKPDQGAKEKKEKEEENADKEEEEEEEEEEEATGLAGEPVELHLEDAWRRLERVTDFPTSERQNEMTPGGDRYIFTADIDGRALYSVKWDGDDRKRLADAANVQHVTLTGDQVVFVDNGRGAAVPPDSDEVENFDISDRLRLDLQTQSSQKFREAARMIGEMFYHPDMKGLDWEELTERYHELALAARTAHEFNYVGNRFLGELNASHMGIRANGPSSPLRRPSGRLGTIHHRVDLEEEGHGYEITEIIGNTPAEIGTMALKVGDIITAVEMEPFGPTDTIHARLKGTIGEEIVVTVLREREDGEEVELHTLLTPISYGRFAELRYRHWRLRNADLVEEWSEGRVGYIHIQAMNQSSLNLYERDLYAAAHDKDGLLIDVRNNGGGWTTDRLLASIMVEKHAYTVPRGADPEKTGHYPQDRLFISRYSLPMNMICNEKSVSNAEIVSHAFKTLERGTLVGQETFGGVISTGSYRLIDGTRVRMPFRGWYLPDGTDMENHGAMPERVIPQKPEDEAANEDRQLKAALEDLQERLDPR